MSPIRLLVVPLSLASVLAAGCGQDAPVVPPSAVAVVGNRTISRAQLHVVIAQARQAYAARGRLFPAAGTRAYETLEEGAVRLLVETAQLEQKAPGLGVSVDRRRVEARRRLLVDQAFGGSEERYRRRLREERMTDAQVRSALRAQILSEGVYEAVTAGVTVGSAAARRYYDEHVGTYTTPASRTIRHILVATEAGAGRARARLRAGEPFAALARRLSRDARTSGAGGLLVLVRGRTAPSLDAVAFALSAGEVSRPFRTRSGWELVQAVTPVRPGRRTPFAAVRETIRERLLRTERDRRFAEWLEGVRREFEPRTAYAEEFRPADGG